MGLGLGLGFGFGFLGFGLGSRTLRASQKTPESLGSWRKASGVKPAAEVYGMPVPPSALHTSPMAACSASSLSPG